MQVRAFPRTQFFFYFFFFPWSDVFCLDHLLQNKHSQIARDMTRTPRMLSLLIEWDRKQRRLLSETHRMGELEESLNSSNGSTGSTGSHTPSATITSSSIPHSQSGKRRNEGTAEVYKKRRVMHSALNLSRQTINSISLLGGSKWSTQERFLARLGWYHSRREEIVVLDLSSWFEHNNVKLVFNYKYLKVSSLVFFTEYLRHRNHHQILHWRRSKHQ